MPKKHHTELQDDWFEAHLTTIGNGMHNAPNEIRHQQNATLIAIGSRNINLRDQAIKMLPQKVGKVEVDHGETSCKTPGCRGLHQKNLGAKKNLQQWKAERSF